MRPTCLYTLILSLVATYSLSKELSGNNFKTVLAPNLEILETTAEASWLFVKPNTSSLPLEMEILGKNQIQVSNLGVFNGISNTEKSIFFKLDRGIIISKSAVFGTDKIKTPRTNLAINSALHFLNGSTYQFRDQAAGATPSWENLSGHNLTGTIVVNPGNTSHINGYVSYDGTGLFIYPLGNGINEYHPLTANGNAGKTITTAWLANDPSGNNDPTDAITSHNRSFVTGELKRVYPNGQWDWHIRSTSVSLSGTNAPGNEAPSAPITISVIIPQDVNLITNGKSNNLRLVGWNGSAWELLSNSSMTSTMITASVNKTFSAITYGSVDDSALPVNLISFSAHTEGDNSILDWETASEINSKYFDIEHSANGKNWSIIGKVLAEGESQKLLTYHFTDNSPITGDNYYRLKMVDIDDSFAYSRILVLHFEETDKIVLYPNPVSEILSIQTFNDWGKITNVSIFDKAGRLMYTSPVKPLPTIDVRQLIGGKYIVRITTLNGDRKSYNIMVSR